MKNDMPKICFAASSGGHFEQLMALSPMMHKYDSFILTEKTEYQAKAGDVRTYYVEQVNRRERLFLFKMMRIACKSFGIFFMNVRMSLSVRASSR